MTIRVVRPLRSRALVTPKPRSGKCVPVFPQLPESKRHLPRGAYGLGKRVGGKSQDILRVLRFLQVFRAGVNPRERCEKQVGEVLRAVCRSEEQRERDARNRSADCPEAKFRDGTVLEHSETFEKLCGGLLACLRNRGRQCNNVLLPVTLEGVRRTTDRVHGFHRSTLFRSRMTCRVNHSGGRPRVHLLFQSRLL